MGRKKVNANATIVAGEGPVVSSEYIEERLWIQYSGKLHYSGSDGRAALEIDPGGTAFVLKATADRLISTWPGQFKITKEPR